MSLTIDNVLKSFPGGHQPVLKNLSLTLPTGKFSALLGPSGCGKTTLLRIIAGLETANAGRIQFEDRTFVDSAKKVNVPAEARGIGMVFQSYAVWPHMTVFENLAFPLRVKGVSGAELTSTVKKMLERVKLEDYAERLPRQLSGGQSQRVALGRALIQKPKLWLLDEPLSNLDANLRASMRKEIRELQKEAGTTAIVVTHDWLDAAEMCDHVAVLRDGHLEHEGSPADVRGKLPPNTTTTS